jgi:hypothetical protein
MRVGVALFVRWAKNQRRLRDRTMADSRTQESTVKPKKLK